MYTAYYSNVNGRTTYIDLSAKTFIGAKREAYRRASGDTASVTVYDKDGNPVATRYATDTYYGFCRGAQPWMNT